MVRKTTTGRRARGQRDPNELRPLFAEIDKDAKATYDSIAAAAGEPLWRVMEECAKHVQKELGTDGLPGWWPSTRSQQEELPLKTA